GAHKMRPRRMRGNLQPAAVPGHRVVGRHDPLLLHAQNVAPLRRGDLATLRQNATPEMAGYLAEELAAEAEAGRVNRIDNVKLLQGDLAEAWREGATDYATVAMRISMVDRTLDKSTGRLLEGSDEPTESTEVWTFRRDHDHGGAWKLSAIQQA
ncbi:MAG: TIM44-like domain-containing protein, partial [Blastochloris sp.]|nr:TIM44-like domain-containing protein [Blastochloris sp.]